MQYVQIGAGVSWPLSFLAPAFERELRLRARRFAERAFNLPGLGAVRATAGEESERGWLSVASA